MSRRRILPLALAAFWLAACSDRSNPLDLGAEPRQPARHIGALPSWDADLFLPDVQLRPGVTADLHLKVFVNEERRFTSCASDNLVLAVPGFAHTAATWRAYAEARFSDPVQPACALIALDLPGHGASGLPEGMPFGTLMLEDYVAALLGVLDELAGSPAAPRTLIGHSQGGIVIQMAQAQLAAAGSSLRAAAGIQEVQLLAPVPPAAVPWGFADSGVAAQVLGPLLILDDPVLGPHASIPPEIWRVLFFSNLAGQVAPGAPSAAEVVSNGYSAPAPLFASLQLIGAPPFARPSVQPGIFAGRYGTRLGIVAFEQDQLIRPEESQALLAYLTEGQRGQAFTVVGGEYAVHDLYLSDPGAILRAQVPTPPVN